MAQLCTHDSRSGSQKKDKNHLKGETHIFKSKNLHLKGALTCPPEQGATPMDYKSSNDQAEGTGFVHENREKKSPLANCPSVICSI